MRKGFVKVRPNALLGALATQCESGAITVVPRGPLPEDDLTPFLPANLRLTVHRRRSNHLKVVNGCVYRASVACFRIMEVPADA